jgi:hypothetical protein
MVSSFSLTSLQKNCNGSIVTVTCPPKKIETVTSLLLLISLKNWNGSIHASNMPCLTLILTAWEFKKPFCKNANKSWMGEAKYFIKIKNALQKILTNFFVSEAFIKNVNFSMLGMII